jgi:hypothetical protein
MIETVKQATREGGGLVILLTVMICAIGGLYKLHTKRLDNLDRDILQDREAYHSLDKRVLVLEIKNGN